MKKYLKWVGLLFVLAAVVLWRLFSSAWIADARNMLKLERCDVPDTTTLGLSFYEATDFSQTDTLFDTVRLSGFVYSITEATDDDETRSIILASSTAAYVLTPPEIKRNAYVYYVDIDPQPKDFTGFGVELCPLAMPDGQYHILLQTEENGVAASRLDTGYVISKVNGHASLVFRPSEQIDSLQTAGKPVSAGFSSMALANGTLTLRGWGILNDVDAKETDVALEVYQGDTLLGIFSTAKENVTYIADYYKDDRYYACGFMAAMDGVTDAEDLKVRVYVGQNGVYSKYTNCFVPDEGNTNLVSVPDVKLSSAIASVEDAQGWANGGINTCTLDENGTLILQGWGIIDGINADDTACAVAVYDDETLLGTYDTQKESAPDIAAYFSNDAYTNSGFSTMVEGISAKELRVRLYVFHEGTWYKCSYYFIPNSDSTAMTSMTE